MALTKSVVINGFDARAKWGLEVLSIDTRGLGPVRRSSTVGGEMVGRVGQTVFHDEQIIRLSGQITGTNRSNLMIRIKSLAQALGVGQDGHRAITLKFEDSTSEWVGQYAGDFRVGEISNAWFVNYITEVSFSIVVQSGSAVDVVNTHTFTGIGDKICKLVQPVGSDYPVRPTIILKNNNAAAITALTLLNFAKRRILRKITGTISAGGFAPAAGAFGNGITITTGTNTLSYATSKLMPWSGAWTIAFRYKRVFAAAGGNRIFWETTSGNNRLVYNDTNGKLELTLNGVVSATFDSILSSLPTTSFTWVVARNSIFTPPPFSSVQDIFINGTAGNTATDKPPSTDPGANIFLGTFPDGTLRAEGIFDEFIIWNRALGDEEISYLNGLNRPPTNLEGVCLYVDFENGVDGIGLSNIETVFSGISLAQNDSLVIDCEKQTAKKITNLFAVTDQISAMSGEFMALEPMDNLIQLLQTGGGAAGTDLTLFYSHRRAA